MINPVTVPVYEYNLTDHLGNVRVLLAEDGTVKQSTDYYPFGHLQLSTAYVRLSF